jgi:hypothetical protein
LLDEMKSGGEGGYSLTLTNQQLIAKRRLMRAGFI